MNAIHLLKVEGELLVEAVEIQECSDEHFPKDLELVSQVSKDIKLPDWADIQFQQPSQEAVSSVRLSVLLHSLRYAAALMQHTLIRMPVNVLPARSHPRSSLRLEFQLRWKPPDNGKDP
ncbi:hypothetical protein AX14_008506 [Amanita brunnescens Koide BX004]|nr:hypothetical protein AX14_008506 [Amanita brunnescens Koide BX004]